MMNSQLKELHLLRMTRQNKNKNKGKGLEPAQPAALPHAVPQQKQQEHDLDLELATRLQREEERGLAASKALATKQSGGAYDRDLELARQLQEEEKRSQPGVGPPVGDGDESLAAMLQQQEMEAVVAVEAARRNGAPQPGSSHSCSLLRHFTGTSKRLFHNKGSMCPASPGRELDFVSFRELHSGPVQDALITVFDYSVEFIAGHLPSNVPVLLICGKKGTNERDKLSRLWPLRFPSFSIVAAPMREGKGKRGFQHAKLHLLRHKTFLRVVISSANQDPGSWHTVGQVVWVCDFPKRGHTLGSSSSPSSPVEPHAKRRRVASPAAHAAPSASTSAFSEELIGFVLALTRNAPAEQTKWCGIVEEYDLTVEEGVSLVASVPGVFAVERYGMGRMEAVIKRSQCYNTFASDDPIWYGASSFANAEWFLLGPLIRNFGSSKKKTRPELKLFWPSHHRRGALGTNFLCFESKNWENMKNGNFVNGPLKGCPPGCSKKHGAKRNHHTCLMHELEPDPVHCAARGGFVHHSKCCARASQAMNGVGWVYLGSHNLSSSAWGSEQKKGLSINNYELGVMLTDVGLVGAGRQVVLPFNVDARRYNPERDVPLGFQRPGYH